MIFISASLYLHMFVTEAIKKEWKVIKLHYFHTVIFGSVY